MAGFTSNLNSQTSWLKVKFKLVKKRKEKTTLTR